MDVTGPHPIVIFIQPLSATLKASYEFTRYMQSIHPISKYSKYERIIYQKNRSNCSTERNI